MKEPNARADFLKRTRIVVAGRSGYRCSIPGCGRVTIGPGNKTDQIADTGTAAHIFSAAENGPRGSGGLSSKELSSAENGIWLCAHHGRLVDTNEGNRYPASLLHSYKGLQEAKIIREMQGIHVPIGWFQELVIDEAPLFMPRTTVRFGKITMVIGENMIGKTALCEFIAGFGDITCVNRWLPHQEKDQALRLSVVYHDPEQRRATLNVIYGGSPRYFLDDREFPFLPSPIRFVVLKEPSRPYVENTDDLSVITDQLNVDASALASLLPFVGQNPAGSVRNLQLQPDEDR
jgi:hypothetical protein